MKHIEEDTILKYLLEVLDDEELKRVRDHLTECEICNAKLNELKNQNELIASYNPEVNNSYIPFLKKKDNYSIWFKRVAVLLVGFILGYSTSVLLRPDKVIIVEQYLIVKSPQVVSADFIQCPNIDIY